MRPQVVKALTIRSFHGTFTDKGRVSELVIFPLSFLVIWGLFFKSGLVESKIASQMLVINLIWSIAGTFQSQANLTLMFDLWSKEFANILRQGVRMNEMVLSHFLFSTLLGLLNLFIFLFFILFSFGGGMNEIRLFFLLFPQYYIGAVGIAALFGGFVLILGRSYGFIAWTGLQLLVMVSSPFSPLDTLPNWFQAVAKLSPFTYVFEYVRFERMSDYWLGLLCSILYLLIGCMSALFLYRRRRATRGLMDI